MDASLLSRAAHGANSDAIPLTTPCIFPPHSEKQRLANDVRSERLHLRSVEVPYRTGRTANMQLAGQSGPQKMSPSIYAALVDSLFEDAGPMFASALCAAVAV